MFDAYLSAYQTIEFIDDQGRAVEYLTPRASFDEAICGVCANTGRIIYSQRAVIEIIHHDMLSAHLMNHPRSRHVVPLELARDALTEARLRYDVLIAAPAQGGENSPVFLDDDRP